MLLKKERKELVKSSRIILPIFLLLEKQVSIITEERQIGMEL